MDLINQEHIDRFSAKLKVLLSNEISLGNEIHETAEGWPYEGSIAIFMKRPFIKRYHTFEDIDYSELNDPHYWKAEYFDKQTKHLLACPF